MAIIPTALLLFLVMNPLGDVPLFFSAFKHVDSSRQNAVVLRELLIALAVLALFLFLGQYLLRVLQISDPALTVAGINSQQG